MLNSVISIRRDSAISLAERLNAAMPGDFDRKAVFVTVGADAVEDAIG